MSLKEARLNLGALPTEPHTIHKGLRPNIDFDYYFICSLVFLNYLISRSGSESVRKCPLKFWVRLKQLSKTDSVDNDLKLTFEKLEPGHV